MKRWLRTKFRELLSSATFNAALLIWWSTGKPRGCHCPVNFDLSDLAGEQLLVVGPIIGRSPKPRGVGVTHAAARQMQDWRLFASVNELAPGSLFRCFTEVAQCRNSTVLFGYEFFLSLVLRYGPLAYPLAFLLGLTCRVVRSRPLLLLLDLNYPQFTAAQRVLLSGCPGGVMLAQANTPSEACDSGLHKVRGPLLFTWNLELLGQFEVAGNLKRSPLAVLAGTGGDSTREKRMQALGQYLDVLGYRVVFTRGQYSRDEYIRLVGSSAIVATSAGIGRDSRIRQTIPESTTTQRVWEGFASGSLVVTEPTQVLDVLGFEAGDHYVSLEAVMKGEAKSILLDKSIVTNIGVAGQAHFKNALDKQAQQVQGAV